MIKEEDRLIKYSRFLSFLIEDIPSFLFEDIPNNIADGILHTEKKIKINKANEKEYCKATEELDCPYFPHLSEEMYRQIRVASKNNDIVRFIYTSRATHAAKLIIYAIYYMVTDRAKLLVVDDHDKEFINSITVEAGFGKIYHDVEYKDLSSYEINFEDYDTPKVPKYIIIEEEVKKILEDPDFIEKWHSRLMRTSKYDPSAIWLGGNPAYNMRIDEQGYYHPTFYNTNDSIIPRPKQGVGVSNDIFEKFEKLFGVYINKDTKYHYEFESDGNYYLYIIRPETFNTNDKYLIDDGRILGGSEPSLLVSINIAGWKDTVFVNAVKHPDIINRILSSPFYAVTKNDYEEAVSDLFENSLIYRNIDFTNTRFMDKLSKDDRYILGEILGQITHIINNNARYRFAKFNNVKDFILVSDDKCNSTLALLGATASAIEIDGKIIVKNSMIQKIKKGMTEVQISFT